VVTLLVFSVLAGRLVQLQALSGAHYEQLALKQRLGRVTLPADRGSIFDRHGRDLALSVQRPTVWANPQVVGDAHYYASKLAPVVGVDEPTLYSRLSNHKLQFVYVARRVDDNVAQRVRALNLPGVAFISEPARVYPAGTLAGPVIGMVGTEQSGLTGLEYEYNKLLRGKAGEIVSERDVRGREIPRTVRSQTPARRGTDIVLTIDEALQYETERSLVDEVAASNAKGGIAVLMDVKTGDILSMATALGASNGKPPRPATATDRNSPLIDVFEPGSTNKVVTISTAIQDGLISPTYPTFAVPSSYSVSGVPFVDDHQHVMKQWTPTDILRESSNVGTIMIAKKLTKERLDTALRAFGLGANTAVQFPGQAAGNLLPLSQYYGIGMASVPIGYGVSVSAQQMLDVYTTLANGGVTRAPRLIDATIDAAGNQHRRHEPPGTRVVSPATAQAMTSMLTQVVSGGTGACAAIPGYTVAGKTGTSRKPDNHGGYMSKYMASFIGYAPAESPRVAAIVVLDEPVPIYGGRAAAPVFSEVAGFALRLLRVPPPDPNSTQWAQAQITSAAAGETCTVPHGADLARFIAQKAQQAQTAASRAANTTASTQKPQAPTTTLPSATSANP
jgi:cell division protein FtsI (penicillin-binding protein 3)